MIQKYKRKPTFVEAEQWFIGKEVEGVKTHVECNYRMCPICGGGDIIPKTIYYVITIHGQITYLADGDWIITEPDKVHYYPCKPDIFNNNYELSI